MQPAYWVLDQTLWDASGGTGWLGKGTHLDLISCRFGTWDFAHRTQSKVSDLHQRETWVEHMYLQLSLLTPSAGEGGSISHARALRRVSVPGRHEGGLSRPIRHRGNSQIQSVDLRLWQEPETGDGRGMLLETAKRQHSEKAFS